MKTIGEILKLSAAHLLEKGVPHPRRSSEELLAHLLKMKRLDLYMQFDRPLDEKELSQFREMVKRRVKREPVEYITGELEFYGCSIRVDRRVLVPRQASEILVDHVVKRIGGKGVLWDICTGSGCLGIAIKKALPDLTVVLSDLSKDALEVAKENAKRNGVDVEILEGDLLAPFEGRKADYVVSNPPYVAQEEMDSLEPDVLDFEPKMALLGGTLFYERFAEDLPRFLNPQGKVFFEIGAWQGEAMKKIFAEGAWGQRELLADWAGRDRFFFLEKLKSV